MGPIPHVDVPAAINARDILLATFTKADLEKGGSSALKLYEILSMNRFLIASRHPDHEFIERYQLGLLVDPDNPPELAKVMRNAIVEYPKYEVSGRMRKYAVDFCSSDILFDRYVSEVRGDG